MDREKLDEQKSLDYGSTLNWPNGVLGIGILMPPSNTFERQSSSTRQAGGIQSSGGAHGDSRGSL